MVVCGRGAAHKTTLNAVLLFANVPWLWAAMMSLTRLWSLACQQPHIMAEELAAWWYVLWCLCGAWLKH